ncbi:hypothetical protein BC937DRAFT_93223, partial [Endogone sp. FLAS-F59071]
TSNHHPHHVHPTAFYHKSQYSPTAFSFPPLVPHPHKVLKSPYSPTASSFPPLCITGATSAANQYPNVRPTQRGRPTDEGVRGGEDIGEGTRDRKEKYGLARRGGLVFPMERVEAGSLDDEILECQLAILNTQMQLSQVLTQTLERAFLFISSITIEVKIAQKTRSCKLKRRVLARLGKKLEGAKGDALRDKKVIEPVSGKAASEQMIPDNSPGDGGAVGNDG